MPTKLPVFYIPHGGGPWPFVEFGFDSAEMAALRHYLENLSIDLPQRPESLLVISAHWECDRPTLMTHPRPNLYYDYYNFPPESYQIQWPAPGAPELSLRIRALLQQAGHEVGEDAERGFDHGTFVPMKLSFPEAELPTTQLSLLRGLDPAQHIRLGELLAPLREEGVLIVGSGMSFHDLRGFFSGAGAQASRPFDQWLQSVVPRSTEDRNQSLLEWATAPGARQAHPREEHLLPLMVAAGAAGPDRGCLDFSGTFSDARISAFRFG